MKLWALCGVLCQASRLDVRLHLEKLLDENSGCSRRLSVDALTFLNTSLQRYAPKQRIMVEFAQSKFAAELYEKIAMRPDPLTAQRLAGLYHVALVQSESLVFVGDVVGSSIRDILLGCIDRVEQQELDDLRMFATEGSAEIMDTIADAETLIQRVVDKSSLVKALKMIIKAETVSEPWGGHHIFKSFIIYFSGSGTILTSGPNVSLSRKSALEDFVARRDAYLLILRMRLLFLDNLIENASEASALLARTAGWIFLASEYLWERSSFWKPGSVLDITKSLGSIIAKSESTWNFYFVKTIHKYLPSNIVADMQILMNKKISESSFLFNEANSLLTIKYKNLHPGVINISKPKRAPLSREVIEKQAVVGALDYNWLFLAALLIGVIVFLTRLAARTANNST